MAARNVPVLKFFTIFFLPLVISAQTCKTGDKNATYTIKNGPSDICNETYISEGCSVTKKCNVGYAMEISRDTQNLTCRGGSWTEEELACNDCLSFGSQFGEKCSKTFCECSSVCSFDLTNGCVNDTAKDSWAVCDLKNLAISVNKNYIFDTIDDGKEATITVQVNVTEADVTVEAIFKGQSTILEYAGNGKYTYSIPLTLSSAGVHTIKASTECTSETEKVTVNITVPAAITRIYREFEDGEVEVVNETSTVTFPTGSNITWTCEATGVGPPKVLWYFHGISISEVQMEDRVYQVIETGANKENSSSSTLHIHPKSGLKPTDSGTYICIASNRQGLRTYTDMVPMSLFVGETTDTEYAHQDDFVIAVTLIGVSTLFTIAAMVAITLIFKRDIDDLKKTKQDPLPKRANDYIPNPMPIRRSSTGSFSDITTTPSSVKVPPQPSTTINMRNRRPATLPMTNYSQNQQHRAQGRQYERGHSHTGLPGVGSVNSSNHQLYHSAPAQNSTFNTRQQEGRASIITDDTYADSIPEPSIHAPSLSRQPRIQNHDESILGPPADDAIYEEPEIPEPSIRAPSLSTQPRIQYYDESILGPLADNEIYEETV